MARILLGLFLLAGSAAAQTLPYEEEGPPSQENVEFLHQEIRRLFEETKDIRQSTPTVVASSQASRIGYSWGSAGRICSSTITVTATSYLKIHASGAINSAGSPWTGYAGYLLDGACPSGHTCHATCTSNVTPYRHAGGASDADAGSFTIDVREAVSAGSHSACIWACSSQGTSATGTILDFWVEYD